MERMTDFFCQNYILKHNKSHFYQDVIQRLSPFRPNINKDTKIGKSGKDILTGMSTIHKRFLAHHVRVLYKQLPANLLS